MCWPGKPQDVNFVRDPCSDLCEIGIFPREGDIYWSWRSSLGAHPSHTLCATNYNAYISQAVKDVRGGQDTIFDAFERVECFFRRLAIYTEVPLTSQMMDTIIQIMVEVLTILGVATKEIKQGQMSK